MPKTDEPPSFSGTYPNSGERIGPAWRDTWMALADLQWHKGMDLAAAVAAAHGLAPKTISNLLAQAAKVGVIEMERRFAGKVGGYRSRTSSIRPCWYRRTAAP